PGGDRRGPAVDRVHPVGVHVVGEARGAADARDEHDPLPGDPQLGHEPLHAREDRVVPAAGAPADLLVALEVLGGELHGGAVAVPVAQTHLCAPSSTTPRMASPTSSALNGRPRTLL